MTSPAVKNNFLPPGLVSNLQQVLNRKRNNTPQQDDADGDHKSNHKVDHESIHQPSLSAVDVEDPSKPVILVTNCDGIDSPGLTFLVEALVSQRLFNVNVCAPQSDKSLSGHSISHLQTIAVSSAEINGATAYEVSGTPVDCVSLALSGSLFAWSKPLLVISGVNRGSSCGHDIFYSSAVAGAREALISGVASLSISLNWKKDESQDSHFKDAVSICLPLINAAIRDIEKGVFPKCSSLHITVPTSPKDNKGFKLTRQSLWRSKPIWQAVAPNRNPLAARFMANQPNIGMQLAQLGRDASAAGAARRLITQKKSLEIVESVGVSGKSEPAKTVKYFRLEFQDTNQEDTDEDLDFRALENGFISITPLSVSPLVEPDMETAASEWISAVLGTDQ